VLAMCMMEELDRRRFRSDPGFRFQLVRRVRALADVSAGQKYDHRSGKVRRVYRELTAARDAALEEARRLFYVGITRVKADPQKGRPGGLFISYPQRMTIADAYGANVAFKTRSGRMANLLPSRFLGELGPAAPKRVVGKV
jgi:superfamily I DNA/RNA helicase